MHRSFRLLLAGCAAGVALMSLPAMGFAKSNNEAERIEVAFVVDTTGSMADLIEGAKRKIWSIANTIVDVNPDADIRMALTAYRDQGDDYVVKSFKLSSDVQGLYGNLVRLEADGGGDTEEAVNEALDEAVRKIEWTRGDSTRRIVFLVGDAPPHMDYENAPKYPKVLKRAAEDNITVNAIQAGGDPDTTKIWREIAQLGHGRYIAIPQDGGSITVIETPFDHDIIILQQKIDKTVMPYGNREKQDELQGKMETKAMAPASVQVDNSRYYSKKGGVKEVVTGGGDLIADIKNGSQQLDTIKDEELPDDMKGKSSVEKKALLDKQTQERTQLEEKMAELVKSRDDFVAKKQSEEAPANEDSFDKAVEETLRNQLK